jgi:hypothetical protein
MSKTKLTPPPATPPARLEHIQCRQGLFADEDPS